MIEELNRARRELEQRPQREMEAAMFNLTCELGAATCPACGGHVSVGFFDYQTFEFGPEHVRKAHCFGCGWSLMADGTAVAG